MPGENLARLEGLAANFGGTDRRFFPGYSVALAPFHALLGEKGYVAFALGAFVATLAVAFRLGRRVGLSGEAAAWGAGLGTLSPAAIQWSAQPVSEPLATLLILGFLARFAAAGLFAVNVLAVVSYAHVLLSEGFEAALGQHHLWGFMLLVLVIFGPGRWALDSVFERKGTSHEGARLRQTHLTHL